MRCGAVDLVGVLVVGRGAGAAAAGVLGGAAAGALVAVWTEVIGTGAGELGALVTGGGAVA